MQSRKKPIAMALILVMTMAQEIYADSSASVKCPELVAAANKAAAAHRELGNAAAEQIDSGEPLKNQTCLEDLGNFNFDFFSSIPSLSGAALKAMKDKVIKELKSMACDGANQAMEAGQKLLTCNAAIGLKLGAGAGFDDINVSECGGHSLDANLDAGNHNVGGGDQASGTVDESIGGSTGGNKSTNPSGDSSWSNWFNQ